jgi:hypothetical protein
LNDAFVKVWPGLPIQLSGPQTEPNRGENHAAAHADELCLLLAFCQADGLRAYKAQVDPQRNRPYDAHPMP